MKTFESHSLLMGYILWIFGFIGSHRFYFGKPVSGTVYFFTFGILGIGWIIDLVLIPGLCDRASRKYKEGYYNYNLAWILLTFGGVFGLHRFYLGKIWTGLLYFFTAGFFMLGILYDFWTLNEQVDACQITRS